MLARMAPYPPRVSLEEGLKGKVEWYRGGEGGESMSQRRTFQLTRTIWLSLAIIVLGYCQYIFDGLPNSDAGYVLVVAMFTLSFPASFLAGALLVGSAVIYEKLFHVSLATSRAEMLYTWCLFVVAGYLQWFYVVPLAYALFRRRRANSSGTH
jgi:hypothetical protein